MDNNRDVWLVGRLAKDVVDYFPHPVNMANMRPVSVLRRKFGNDGYAVWNIVRENLGRSDGFWLGLADQDEFEDLAAECDVGDDVLEAILAYLASRNYIDAKLWERRIVWMPEFVASLAPVYSKRGRKLPDAPDVITGTDTAIPEPEKHNTGTENRVTGAEKQQSIVKDSEVKDSIYHSDKGSGEKGKAKPSPARAKHEKSVDDFFKNLKAGSDVYDGFVRDYPTIDLDAELARACRWLKNNMTKAKRRGKKAADGVNIDFSEWLADAWLDREEKTAKGRGKAKLPDGVPAFVDFLMEINRCMDSFDGNRYKRSIENKFTKWVFEEIFGGVYTYRETGAGYLNNALEKAYNLGVDKERKKKEEGV